MAYRFMTTGGVVGLALIGAALGLFASFAQAQGTDSPLRVVVTVPDLGSLAQEVGGDRVAVTVLAKGTEDPHFVDAKPSFIKVLSQADVYIQLGMDLEIGWAPTLLQQARNANVLPGAPGYVDASVAVEPLEVPSGTIDRSMGDIHVFGNPHYLLDPVRGLKVARLIRDRLMALQPASRGYFEERFSAFHQRLGSALVGQDLAHKYDVEKLALLNDHDQLQAFLQAQGDAQRLAGWLGRLTNYAGTLAIGDHNQWPYFAQRFRLRVVAFLEPKPGIPPTTKHLQALVKRMQAQHIGLILASAYYDPRHARFLAQQTGAKIAEIANQVGAREGTDTYLQMVEYNVQQIIAALGGA